MILKSYVSVSISVSCHNQIKRVLEIGRISIIQASRALKMNFNQFLTTRDRNSFCRTKKKIFLENTLRVFNRSSHLYFLHNIFKRTFYNRKLFCFIYFCSLWSDKNYKNHTYTRTTSDFHSKKMDFTL